MHTETPSARAISHGRRLYCYVMRDGRSSKADGPIAFGPSAYYLGWRRGVAESIDRGRGRFVIRPNTHDPSRTEYEGIQW